MKLISCTVLGFRGFKFKLSASMSDLGLKAWGLYGVQGLSNAYPESPIPLN